MWMVLLPVLDGRIDRADTWIQGDLYGPFDTYAAAYTWSGERFPKEPVTIYEVKDVVDTAYMTIKG